MNFVLVGKRAAQLETVKSHIEGLESWMGLPPDTITICEKPSELVKDSNTKIIFVDVIFAYAWEWWMSADISNEYNRRKFEDEIMEFRQLDTSICDYVIDYDGTEMTVLNEKIYNYILSEGGGEQCL